jgi:hypothetical protein
VYLFRYLYALKVKGFSGPMPVLAVEALSEESLPVAFREEIEEAQGERIFGRYRL